MVRAHVTLTAGLGRPRQLDRGDVASMAGGAGTDRTVPVRAADVVALQTSLVHRDRTFPHSDRRRNAIDCALVVLLGKGDLLGGEVGLAAHGRPRGRCVPAPKELLILGLMA